MNKNTPMIAASVLVTCLLSAGAIARGPSRSGVIPDKPPPTEVARLIGAVSSTSAKGYVEKLVSFGTRQTFSETESQTRGIGAARRWIKSEFDRIASEAGRSGDEAIKVYFDRHLQKANGRRVPRDVEIVNVVLEIPGSMPEARARRYYVIGHYDSIPSRGSDSESDAPGADDDASGTAVAMELARVLSKARFDATVVFMPVAAEEQGLFGAKNYARAAKEAGLDIRAVLSNDIVGDPGSPSGKRYIDQIRVFSEGLPAAASDSDKAGYARFGTFSDSPSRQLARYVAEVAEWEKTAVRPMLIFRKDRFGRGGDHSAFNEFGYPAIRFCEVVETYTRQHQNVRVENGVQYGDLPEHVDADYLADVTRLNGVALIHLANAPSSPAGVRVRGRTAQTTVRWQASPEPDVAGYEVVWRATTSPVWEHSQDVGNETSATLQVSRDNNYFGVRAYDKDGYRSPVSFSSLERAPRRRRQRPASGRGATQPS